MFSFIGRVVVCGVIVALARRNAFRATWRPALMKDFALTAALVVISYIVF